MFTIVSVEEQVFDVTTNHSIDHRVHCVDSWRRGEKQSLPGHSDELLCSGLSLYGHSGLNVVEVAPNSCKWDMEGRDPERICEFIL